MSTPSTAGIATRTSGTTTTYELQTYKKPEIRIPPSAAKRPARNRAKIQVGGGGGDGVTRRIAVSDSYVSQVLERRLLPVQRRGSSPREVDRFPGPPGGNLRIPPTGTADEVIRLAVVQRRGSSSKRGSDGRYGGFHDRADPLLGSVGPGRPWMPMSGEGGRFEIPASSPSARRFYGPVFGWKMTAMPER